MKIILLIVVCQADLFLFGALNDLASLFKLFNGGFVLYLCVALKYQSPKPF